MKPNQDYIKMYRQAEKANDDFLKTEIVKHLAASCPKFVPERIDACIEHIKVYACEMLGGRKAAKSVNGVETLSGAVSSDTVFRMARDYFNDEMWKNEKEEPKTEKKKEETAKPGNDDPKADIRKAPEQVEGQLNFFAAMGVAK